MVIKKKSKGGHLIQVRFRADSCWWRIISAGNGKVILHAEILDTEYNTRRAALAFGRRYKIPVVLVRDGSETVNLYSPKAR